MALTEVPSSAAPGPTAPEGPAQISTARRWTIFAIVATALFMTSIDMTIISTAIRPIHRSLHAPLNWTGWTITAFTLGMLITMPVAGRLSDQFGRKKVFLSCAVLFTVASLACGLATNIYELIALRAVQAIGGGAFMPSATGIVSDHFGRNRDRAIAMFTSVLPAGGIIGPVLGGIFVAYWSWRWIFFVNVPLGLLVVVAGARLIPYSGPKPGARADLKGVALLGATVLLAMFGVTSLGDGHAALWSPTVLPPEIAALLVGWHLIGHLRTTGEAILPIELFRMRQFLVMNLLNVLYGAAVLGIGALVPLYAEDRYHFSALSSGTVLTARAVGTILVAGVTSFLLRRIGYRLPMAVGFVTIALGSGMLAAPPQLLGTYAWVALATAITGLGMGMAMPATNNATLSLATENVAVITGTRGMFRNTGSIIAVEVMTAVLNRVSDAGLALAIGYVVVGALLLLAVPFIYTVPDHRGSW
ncbi:MAG TPA: MFS transporter [Acidimicrobiales bacterium]|nr:MFS transporter [Acidimicrobiales bacterium]